MVVPWLSKVDQAKVFPNGLVFDTPEHQEDYVRNWVEKRTVGFSAPMVRRFWMVIVCLVCGTPDLGIEIRSSARLVPNTQNSF